MPDLRVEVLLELQLLFESLDAILSIHPPQHLVLQLLPGVAQAGVQLRKKPSQKHVKERDERKQSPQQLVFRADVDAEVHEMTTGG